MGDSLSFYGTVDVVLLKVKPQFHSCLWRVAIKKGAKGGSKLDTVKPGIIKKQMVLGCVCVYTTSLNCGDIKHTHTGTLTITHISVTQRRELGNVKRKSRLLFSVNGPVVKCRNMSFFSPVPLLRHDAAILCHGDRQDARVNSFMSKAGT